ncbi:hypothetical protein WN944_026942 [Citrus x changshan-huyou]|uniref:Uncharacterized protein n=1 Tax=Citrus x changshan-huyou TaxID=2935761 RepID=A0AAP0LGM0_9ROSI
MSSNDTANEVDVNRVFIGAGCNRIVNNVSWGASDLVSFGAQNAVTIFCPKVLTLNLLDSTNQRLDHQPQPTFNLLNL